MTLGDNAQEIYDWFIGAPFHIILILVIALFFQKVGARAVAKAINRIADADFVPGPKRGMDRQRERARSNRNYGSSGVVESVGLRITTDRSLDGTLWYLRNGEILKIGNKSQPKAN
jgi:hypothetical protein